VTRRRFLWVVAFALGAVLVVVPIAASPSSPSSRAQSGGSLSGAGSAHTSSARPVGSGRLAAAVEAAVARGGGSAEARLTAMLDTPGMPTCAPPPIPAATNPPGAAYGVPFLAAITNGQVLAGYDEWTANHLVWTADNQTFNLDPWQSKIYDITGWVTGLLELPSLTAQIAPQDVVFCDNQGGASCLSADWPAGQCIEIEAQYGPSPASETPPPAIGSYHPEGTSCTDYQSATFECFPYVVSLTASGTTSLTVTGVAADGALQVSVSTAAVTTVNETPPPPSTSTFTCQGAPVKVTLSTEVTALPATAPIAPTPPNTDERTPQTPPQPLTGPLSSSSSTIASNDFSVPAFFPSAGGTPCTPFLAESLNTYAGGWDSKFSDQSEGLYYVDGGKNPIAAEPGWAQFSATTTVVTLGLPVGPPPGFSF
jgi:hypothetical protein